MLSIARLRWTAGALALTALLAAPLRAANPRDELLRFVPDDVGFCVVVQNLRDTGKAVAESPFAEQFRASAVGQALQKKEEVAKLLGVEGQLKEYLGVGWAEIRDDLLGDAVVFAYRFGPPGKRNEEQGLMLIRARNEKTLARVIDRFNEKQKATGDLEKLEEVKYRGFVYFRRVEKRETSYYHLRGPILVFSAQEEMLQRALDLDAKAPADQEPALTAWLRQLGADRALLAVYLNPRAFDADLKAQLDKARDGSAAFLKTFLVYWEALDGVCLSLTLDRDATLAVGVRGRPEKLPSAARRLFAELAKPGALWRQFPDDALLASGGRIDFAAFADALGDFLTPDNREKMRADLNDLFRNTMAGKDVLKDLVPLLGPDLGFCLTAPADPKHLFPEGLFALRVRPGGDKTAPADQAVLNQLKVFADIAVLGFRVPGKPLVPRTAVFDKQEVRYLESDALPPGVKPAFGLKNGFLLLASSPDLIGRFATPSASPEDGPAPLLRVSFKAWRGYLQARRETLTKLLAARDRLSAEEAADRLETVLTVLEFVDRLEVRYQAGKGTAVVSITVRTAQPLQPLRK